MKNRKSKFIILLLVLSMMQYWNDGEGTKLYGQSRPGSDPLSQIRKVELFNPVDSVIFDPFSDTLQTRVYTFPGDIIWGVNEPFPENVIYYSLNRSYEWDQGKITKYLPAEDRYNCQSQSEFIIDEAVNTIYFHASYLENNDTTDEMYSFNVKYVKPVVDVKKVNTVDETGQTIVVNSSTDVNFTVDLTRSFLIYPDPDGFDRISALLVKHVESDKSKTWTFDNPVLDSTDIVISLASLPTSLIPGYNTFKFLAKGLCKDNCEEYSDTVTVQVFYLDYEATGPKVCQDNTVYELTGIPEGGFFSGEGIINQTTLLNPSLASEGFHTLTYHYMVEGGEYMVPRDMEFVTLPDFELLGYQEVCQNAWDISYSVNSLTGDYDNITWNEVQGGEIITENNDKSMVTIHWNGQGLLGEDINTGKITITMDKNGCSATKEFLVNIRITEATNPAFIMLYNNNLLICDDTSALYFEWYINDALKYTTDVPYCFLGEAYTPIDGDEYYVLTAIELCDTSCLTKSNTYVWNSGGFKAFVTDQNELLVYPSPSNGEFTILLPGMENNQNTLTISNSSGRVVASIPVKPSVSGKECRINGRDWPAGIYLLRLDGYSSSLFKKIMITR